MKYFILKNTKNIYFFLWIFFSIFVYFRTLKETEFGDFHVFWYAGKQLITGNDIYTRVNTNFREFIYPPFAAFFFIPLSILPFKIACYLFFQINLVCFIYSAKIVKKIIEIYCKEYEKVQVIFAISLLLIFKLSWNNLMMIQSNQVVYLFSILGIYYFIRKKENLAIAFFCISISLKIFPVIFAFWVVIRGSKTAILKFLLGALICILLPILFQGFDFGLNQLHWFFYDFLLASLHGKNLGFSYASQSIPSLLHRVFVISTEQSEPGWHLINLGETTTMKLIFTIQILLMATMLFTFIFLRLRKAKILFHEPAIVILTTHLISACTWKAHLVGLIVVFGLISKIILDKYYDKGLKWTDYLFISYLLTVSLLGQILIGPKLQKIFGAYGEYTFEMIFCLIVIYYNLFKDYKLFTSINSNFASKI